MSRRWPGVLCLADLLTTAPDHGENVSVPHGWGRVLEIADLTSLNTKGAWLQPFPEEAFHFKFLPIPVKLLLMIIKIT